MLINLYFGLNHGSRAFKKPTGPFLEIMNAMGMTENLRYLVGVFAILSAILTIFPSTFFLGNVLRSLLLLVLIALALNHGNYKFALIEIPFLLIPLLLIYLGHPFKSGFGNKFK